MSKLKLTEGIKEKLDRLSKRSAPANDEIGCGFAVRVAPKANLMVVPRDRYLERDGKRFLATDGGEQEIPAEADVVFEGDPQDLSKMDVVVVLHASLIKKSILLAGNRAPVAQVAMGEVGRMPLDEFLSRADAIFQGAQEK